MNYSGLTSDKAKELLKQNGSNALEQSEKINPVKIYLSQFASALIIILVLGAAVSFLMSDVTEAITILTIVIANSFIGFFQEYRTEKTLSALSDLSAPKAAVIRDGVLVSVPADTLVVGDLIYVSQGNRVPGDGKITDCVRFACDESMLTGESVPCDKNTGDKIYMGTVVTKGHCHAILEHTGMNTEMGHIAGMLKKSEKEETPLQQKLSELGKFIGIACIIICTVVSITGILRGENILDMMLTGISLAVAAVPEGLPAIVTVALALSVKRMVKRNALIRRLHAAETLGCAGVICTDKTGTLTQNKMTVVHAMTLNRELKITGQGYERNGGIEGVIALTEPEKMLFNCCVICNHAEIYPTESTVAKKSDKNEFSGFGEPTEFALLVAAAKTGIVREDTQAFILDEIPFDSDRKMMSVKARFHDKTYIFTKGAPDKVLKLCGLTKNEEKKIADAVTEYASRALRVIAAAYKETRDEARLDRSENGLTFLGLFALYDPPRPEARRAVMRARQAGIRTVMITGDHRDTALAVAKETGIYREGGIVITGSELDRQDDESLKKILKDICVFARVSPSHKLRIVHLLKQSGEIVAMTGDGINDAPAIRDADIGIAMGRNGTDVAKEAADLVLLDDNFSTIISAVEEGRTTYSNIRKFIRYLLSCNIGEVLCMFLGMLFGMPVTLLPIHILIVNLVTDGFPAIALGLEPTSGELMKMPPRKRGDSVLSNGLLSKIIFRGILIALFTLLSFSLSTKYGGLETARTAALFTLVLSQLIHVFECKSETHGLMHCGITNNLALIVSVAFSLLVLFVCAYFPPAYTLFKTVPLYGAPLACGLLCSLGPTLTTFVSGLFSRRK